MSNEPTLSDMDEGLRIRLNCWLHEATSGLSASASKTIAAEINAHCLELFDALAVDHPRHEAAILAIAKLGDARDASKRFAKSHLSAGDVHILESRYGIYTKWGVLANLYVASAIAAMTSMLGTSTQARAAGIMWLAYVAQVVTCYFSVALSAKRRTQFRLLISFAGFCACIASIGLAAYSFDRFRAPDYALLLGFAGVALSHVGATFTNANLLRKFHLSDNSGRESGNGSQ